MENIRIRDGKKSDPGWKNVGSGINIPDPQHCFIDFLISGLVNKMIVI
jgi:hypothetical protein